MDYLSYIYKYYPEDDDLRRLLLKHSRQVADRCMKIAKKHRELPIDVQFLEEAAMLHDIGIFRCQAPSIFCNGTEPYICHGQIGGKLLRAEGFPRHARVCERHTGAGLTKQQIISQSLPLPHEDFLPETQEEQIICYADKFFSKTHPEIEKSYEQALKSIEKFGEEGAERFKKWHKEFNI